MSAAHLLIWVALPYVAITVFIVGHIWRYRTDQYGWTTRSTQLLESRAAEVGERIFHYGALAAIGGHVLGILVPAGWTSAFGVSEHPSTCSPPLPGRWPGSHRRRRASDPRLAQDHVDSRAHHHQPHGHRRLPPVGARHRTRYRRDDRPEHARRRLRLPRHRLGLVPQHRVPPPPAVEDGWRSSDLPASTQPPPGSCCWSGRSPGSSTPGASHSDIWGDLPILLPTAMVTRQTALGRRAPPPLDTNAHAVRLSDSTVGG